MERVSAWRDQVTDKEQGARQTAPTSAPLHKANYVDLTAESSSDGSPASVKIVHKAGANQYSYRQPTLPNMFVKPAPRPDASSRPSGQVPPLRPLENKAPASSVSSNSSSIFNNNSNRLHGMPPIPKRDRSEVKPPTTFASSAEAFQSKPGSGSGGLTAVGVKARIMQQMELERKKLGIPFAVPQNAPLGSGKHRAPLCE